MLQCVAVGCSVLQRVATRCSVIQGVAVCCKVLQCVAVCCAAVHVTVSLVRSVTICCIVMRSDTVCFRSYSSLELEGASDIVSVHLQHLLKVHFAHLNICIYSLELGKLAT